jgi:hypothetical protein
MEARTLDGWMDGWMEGWMDGWMDGWMNGWMDGWILSCHSFTGESEGRLQPHFITTGGYIFAYFLSTFAVLNFKRQN